MLFVFVIGPALIIVWLAVPFLLKPAAFRGVLDSTQSYVLGHAWLAHALSLTTKVIGLRVSNRIAGIFVGSPPLVGDWIPILYPFSAGYFLTIGFLVGALVEYGYCRWVLGASGRRVLVIFLVYNFFIDSIIAVPSLIFYIQFLAGDVGYI